MKISLQIASILVMLFFANDVVAGRCTGSSYCSACKNCSACKHCNGGGGSCGVCGGGDSYSKPGHKKKSYGNDNAIVTTDQGSNSGSSYSSPSSTSTYNSYSSYKEDSKSSPWIWIIIVLIVLYLIGKSSKK